MARFAHARDLLLAYLRQRPDDFDALALMTDALIKLGELAQAEYYARRALKGRENEADAWTILTMWQVAARRAGDAEASALRAMQLDPTNPERYRHAAAVHVRLNQFGKMAVASAAGAEISPQDDDLHLKHGVALLALGQVEDSARVFRRACTLCPTSLPLAEGLASGLNYATDATEEERIEAHRRFGALLALSVPGTPARPALRPRTTADGVTRPLRVGLLSPDLRRHSVAYFARPLVEHLDPARIDLRVYSPTPDEDATSAELRAIVQARFGAGAKRADGTSGPVWRTYPKPDPAAIAGAIRDDAVDVLIELSGLTAGHAQRVMIRRPAPVQVSYLGYPSVTGVPTIDARIVDAITDPPGPAEGASRGVERLVRVPAGCFVCYSPPREALDMPPEPDGDARAARPITFGSFNLLRKVNQRLLALWKRVLDRVPGSRLLIKTGGLEQDEVRASLRLRLDHAGIAAERVELRGPTKSLDDHLRTYHEIDVALDTFPYCGTTTTCEALVMGRPVVSLVGDGHASRVGASLLNACGLSRWATGSEDEYVDLAASVAAQVRGTGTRGASDEAAPTGDLPMPHGAALRARVLASPLCDGRAFCERFTNTIDGLAKLE